MTKYPPRAQLGTSMTRAKSMGFLNQLGQEGKQEENKTTGRGPTYLSPEAQGLGLCRPSSFPPLLQTMSHSSLLLAGRGDGPLSADLTAKFESIGLSLHRKNPSADSKENTSRAEDTDKPGGYHTKHLRVQPSPIVLTNVGCREEKG